MSKKKPQKTDIYTRVTETIIRRLKEGVVPWRRPWDNRIGCPRNLVSGAPYQGINILLLGSCGYSSPYWMTFLQAKEAGGMVQKGAKAEQIVKVGKTKPKEDDDEEPRSFLRLYHVFNVNQIDGVDVSDPLDTPATSTVDLGALREAIAYMPKRPEIVTGERMKASYSIPLDRVNMPPMARFKTKEEYYLTLFHELTHSTGHEKRLNRRSLLDAKERGDTCYSFEELVAEMGAAYLGARFGIVLDRHKASASYINGWLNALKSQDNRKWILAASKLARQAVEWICTEEDE